MGIHATHTHKRMLVVLIVAGGSEVEVYADFGMMVAVREIVKSNICYTGKLISTPF